MLPRAYNTGVKQAFSLQDVDWDRVREVAKRTAIGEPGKFWDQLKSNQLLNRKDGLWRRPFSGYPAAVAARWALPAVAAGQLLASDSDRRGSAVGRLAGAMTGSVLGGPLGIPGAMLGSALMAPVGASAGSLFDRDPAQLYL